MVRGFLAALALSGALAVAGAADAQVTASHIYDLNGSLNDTVGTGPSMGTTGDVSSSGAGYNFNTTYGGTTSYFSLGSSAFGIGDYSVEMSFSLSNVQFWANLVSTITNPQGPYAHYSSYGADPDFISFGASSGGPGVSLNTSHDLVMTHTDSGTNIYLDGQEVISGADASFSAVTASNVTFFYDGFNGDGSSGFLDFVRIYNDGLTGDDVSYLWNGGLLQSSETVAPRDGNNASGPIPEAATWAMMLVGFGGIGTALRRRRIAVAVA